MSYLSFQYIFINVIIVFMAFIVDFVFFCHQNWYSKTPLGKKRIKASTGKEEEEAVVKGKDAKKKGKK